MQESGPELKGKENRKRLALLSTSHPQNGDAQQCDSSQPRQSVTTVLKKPTFKTYICCCWDVKGGQESQDLDELLHSCWLNTSLGALLGRLRSGLIFPFVLALVTILKHSIKRIISSSEKKKRPNQQITNILPEVSELLRKHFTVLPHLHYTASAQLQTNKRKLLDCNQQDL